MATHKIKIESPNEAARKVKDKVTKAGLMQGCDDAIFIEKAAFGKNWKVLHTKVGGCQASVMFSFATEHQALQAGRKIAEAIGGQCYGTNDPRN